MKRIIKSIILWIYIRLSLIIKLTSLWLNKKINVRLNIKLDLYTSIDSDVTIGNNCNVQSSKIMYGTYICDHWTIRHSKVGKFCAIADNVKAGLGTHPTNIFVSIHPAFFSTIGQAGFSFVAKNMFDEMPKVQGSEFVVEIGNDVWIGSGVRILDGVKIGNGAIIGANAVVTKDIEPYSINVGVPAKKIKYRFSLQEIEFLDELQWWDKDTSWIRENVGLFQDIKLLIKKING